MNERFVAVSTVTGSRIRGWFSEPRCDFSVMRGWQQMMNAIRWIKQFAEKTIYKNDLLFLQRKLFSLLCCLVSAIF